jgi:hypothetical protein
MIVDTETKQATKAGKDWLLLANVSLEDVMVFDSDARSPVTSP